MNDLHKPTLIKAVVVFAVIFVAYHFLTRRRRSGD